MQNLLLSVNGAIAEITINRPSVLNALNREAMEELEMVIQELSVNQNVRAVIVTGAGEKAFVAGADIKELAELAPRQAKVLSERGQRIFAGLEHLPQVVIAAVNGYALGAGCELCLACDIRLASGSARFALPEINLGIIPGYAGSQRLARLIGIGRAKEMVLTGKSIDSAEAYRIGLINRICEDVVAEARELAAEVSCKGGFALMNAKSALNHGVNMDLTSACSFEADAFSLCFSSPDQKEGMHAFIEKRKPKFNSL